MPILKYDARAGTLYTQDRVYRDGSWQTEQHDVTDGFNGILDLANTQKGWFLFPKGAAPEMVLFPFDADIGAPPSADHREGLRLLAKLEDEDVVRELVSTALAFWTGADVLQDQFLAAAADHPDEVPVVELTDVTQVTNTQGNVSYQPVFAIVDWVSRPADLPEAPSQRSQSKVPPKTQPRRRADMDDEIPF